MMRKWGQAVPPQCVGLWREFFSSLLPVTVAASVPRAFAAQITEFTSVLFTGFGGLSYGSGAPRLSALLGMGVLLVIEIAQFLCKDVHYYERFPVPARGFLIAAMIAITLIGMSNEPAQFIYFQF